MIWKVRDHEIDCSQPRVMAVLNLTPDSFSDGGKYFRPEEAVSRALEMAEAGADILDLGAESTRPGAEPVPANEEVQRLLPVLRLLRAKISIPISIDTTKSEVAGACLKEGAHIINDVSGLKDSGIPMAETVRKYGAGLVLMHRRGNPQTMQGLTGYGDVVRDVLSELREGIDTALDAGLSREQIVIDPGLGFAKTAEQNLEILRHLEIFHDLGFPVLIGPSRKSFLGRVTGRPVNEREFATAAVLALARSKGVQIYRVHEAGPAWDAIRTAEAIQGGRHVGTF